MSELSRPPRNIKINTNVELPQCSVVLPPRDDAAEYDDSADTHKFDDDPKLVNALFVSNLINWFNNS